MLKTYLNVTALVTGRNFTKRRILCAGSLVECAAWSWWRPGAGHLRRVQEANRCQHVSWACGSVVAGLNSSMRQQQSIRSAPGLLALKGLATPELLLGGAQSSCLY